MRRRAAALALGLGLLLGACGGPEAEERTLNPFPVKDRSECPEGHGYFDFMGERWCVAEGKFTNPDAPEWLSP